MQRRTFIKKTCIASAGVGLIGFLQACTSHKYITDFHLTANKITVKKSSFVTIKKEKQVQQKFILLKPDNFQFPIVLYKLQGNEYSALLLQCTHQGCELTPYETMMVCPCHGAEFNNKGEVTQGPADINLNYFPTTQDDENIYIQL